jgi:hypothetical protein
MKHGIICMVAASHTGSAPGLVYEGAAGRCANLAGLVMTEIRELFHSVYWSAYRVAAARSRRNSAAVRRGP